MQFTVKLSRTKILSLLLVLSMLAGSVGWYQYAQATTANAPWTLNGPPTSAYDWTIGKYVNGTYYRESSDWQTWVNSDNATTIINAAIATSGVSVLITTGIYTIYNSITASNVNNITLTLTKGTKLIEANNQNNSVIFLAKCSNWIIQGGEIDGNNAANLADGNTYRAGNGIHLENCTNITIQNMDIRNCRVWGIVALYKSSEISILNNYISNCNWNGITLGDDWTGFTTTNCIVSNNHITYCGDLGISLYGNYIIASNNQITNMTYTHTYGGADGTHWGIATEGYSQWCTIQNNIVTGCDQAIVLSTSGTAPVYTVVQNNMANNITYSGVSVQSGNYSLIENNAFRTCFFGIDIAAACTYTAAIGNDYRAVTNTAFNNAGGVTNTNNCYLDGSGYHA
jgi:parallel beta-helix repeat protein